MYIDGYAFKSNEKELQERNTKRFNEIKHLRNSLNISTYPCYGHTKFTGELNTEETKNLSEFDLALLADYGNLCFGGECTKNGNTFKGRYNID